jgi:hypothetical protein
MRPRENTPTKGSISLDSKLLLSPNPGSLSGSPEPQPSNGDTTGAAETEPAPSSATGLEDEPIRPFVYRVPTGKASGSEPPHPHRRRSDIEPTGN